MKLEEIAKKDKNYDLVGSHNKKDLRVVLIKDNDEKYENKFIHGTHKNKTYIISLPRKECEFHWDIKEEYEKELGYEIDELDVEGGGFLKFYTNFLRLSGKSESFGYYDDMFILPILEKLGYNV